LFIKNQAQSIDENPIQLIAQDIISNTSANFIITDIILSGNRKTKDYIILREMKLKKGDEIIPSQLFRRLSDSRDLIYNTTLFSIVELTPVFGDSNRIIIKVNLVERWYIYPSPVFKLADRNFNEWYKTNKADFERVTYGVKFSHNNLTGRGDEFNIFLLNGYSRNFTIGYSLPYINRSLTLGVSFKAGYLENREVAYKTSYYNKILTYIK
jgi:outer membrane protein assembly factor BamA